MATTVAPLQGTKVSINEEALAELRMMIHGEVLTPEDPGYANVPAAYNAMYPGSPDLVIRAKGVADVMDAVKFARAQGLTMAIRAGGHSVAGLSSIDGGMLLDLSLMTGVRIDLDAKTVTCEGGARWGDVDRETAVFGLVAPGGIVSDTGVAGLTLGGGEGWVRRKYGLACDNLVEAQVVTAEAELLTANAKTNKDLFWALRGGGGNFGVVTSFTFKLSPLPPVVGASIVFYAAADAEQVLRGYRDFMKDAPNEITALCACTTLPASEHTPPEIHNVPVISVGAVYTGDPQKGLELTKPLRELATPVVDISGELPFAAGVQKAFDEFFQRGVLRSYWKATYLDDFSDDAVALIANAYKNRASTRTLVVVFSWGGAINDVGAEDTANAERSAKWMFSCDGNWEDPAEDHKVIAWVRERFAEVHKIGLGSVYLNFTGISDEGADVGVDDAFARNLKKLREIKKKYDPTNFFRMNNNIKPA